jgi:AraC-like DNA-binding protein
MHLFLRGWWKLTQADEEEIVRLGVYIRTHCQTEIKIDSLAKLAHMSPTKLKKSFRAYYGAPVYRFIIEERLARAERLLSDSDLPIGEIAQIVGYKKASAFTLTFKRHKGCLPRDYRHMARS